jgi:hypothetical protein
VKGFYAVLIIVTTKAAQHALQATPLRGLVSRRDLVL